MTSAGGSSSVVSAGEGAPPGVLPADGPGRWWFIGVGVVVAAVAVFLVVSVTRAGEPPAPVVHAYVIPAGTGARMDAGEAVEILPARLDVRVGDELVITNEDDRAHVAGPLAVAPGETLRTTFRTPGTFRGVCSVHPSGELVVVVR